MEVRIKPLSVVERFLDVLMIPFMYIVQGNLREFPQGTHAWNYQRISQEVVKGLDEGLMAFAPKDQNAGDRWIGFIPWLHLPVLGGWKSYVVLKPKTYIGSWHVGWVVAEEIGVSRVPLSGKVRMLKGGEATKFFGISENGDQIAVESIGEGRLGKNSEFSKITLL